VLQDSADKGKIAEMRKLAQLRKAAEAARLQAKRMATSNGEPEPVLQCGVMLLVTRVSGVAGAAADSDSDNSLLEEDEFFVKN
jgi:hypothetical protein